MPDEEEETTLADLRVLDLSDGVAGAYCAALFAGYGADVILVEPPSGNPLRHHPAWDRLAAGKRSLTLDLRTTTGRLLFRDMVEGANLVVECFPPGTMDALGLGFADLQSIKRRIILTSVQGAADPLADYAAGLNAFAASAIAAENADSNEIPQRITISARECVASAAELGLRLPSDEAAFGAAPFEMSAIPWANAPAPDLGEHNVELFCEEMGLRAADLPPLARGGGHMNTRRQVALPPSLTIRRYEARDHDAVWSLHLEGVVQTRSEYTDAMKDAAKGYEDDLHNIEATYLGEGSNFWVIEATEGLVAMSAIERIDAKTGRLRRMRVTEAWRRHGLAMALLDTIVDFCRESGYDRIILDTTKQQAAAHKLYERYGFTPTGEHMVGSFLVYDYEMRIA